MILFFVYALLAWVAIFAGWPLTGIAVGLLAVLAITHWYSATRALDKEDA